MKINDIKSFKLGAREYNIKKVEHIDETGLGRTYSPRGLILLANTCNGKELPNDSIEQTLYHEVTHAILDELGYYELSSDEKFVQSFSLLLHQFEKTKS